MRIAPLLFAILVLAAVQRPAHADEPRPGPSSPAAKVVPNACFPGYYNGNVYGGYGFSNWPVLPPAPYNGAIFARQATYFPGSGAQGNNGPAAFPGFPSHPYARSPRDFFMWSEAQEDLHTRERRPGFVP